MGDLGSIPGSGRSSGEGNGNPLQYFVWKIPWDGGTWEGTVHGVAKSQTRLSDFTFTLASRMRACERLVLCCSPVPTHSDLLSINPYWVNECSLYGTVLYFFPLESTGQGKDSHVSLWWESAYELLSRVRLFATPWTGACQDPLSMGFSRQESWSELPFPSPGDPPNPGIEPRSPTL